jgi:hypothetical protein
MTVSSRRLTSLLLRWGLAVALLVMLVRPHLGVLSSLAAASWQAEWLLAGFGLRLISVSANALRWQLLLISQEIRIPWQALVRLVCAGFATNFVIPGTIGGDVTKAGLLAASQPGRIVRGSATIVLDRVIGLFALVMLGALAGGAQWSTLTGPVQRGAVTTLLVMAGGGCLGVIVFLGVVRVPATEAPPRAATGVLARLWREGWTLVSLLRARPGAAGAAVVISLFSQACVCLTFECCLMAVSGGDPPLSVARQFWLVPAAEVATAAIPVPGGLGAREGAQITLYAAHAQTAEMVPALEQIGLGVALLFNGLSVLLAAGCAVCAAVLRAPAAGAMAAESGSPAPSGVQPLPVDAADR